MILLACPIFALINCFLAVVLFEALYAALKADRAVHVSKPAMCAVWWMSAIVVAAVIPGGSPLGFLLSLPFFVVVARSHHDLATIDDGIIAVKDVATNVPSAIRACLSRIHLFIKK